MFEVFTRSARAAVVMAQEEARMMGHDHVGTEHVLLGTLACGNGPGARALAGTGVDGDHARDRVNRLGDEQDEGLDADALATVGIDLEEVRRATEETFGPGALDRPRQWRSGHIPFDHYAKKCLELALREAVNHGHKEINDGHVLLGILRGEPNPATGVLAQLGVDLAELREAVDREFRSPAA